MPGPSIQATQNSREDNVFTFQVNDLPALVPTSNEPLPFYQFFWDFGDGHFSENPRPTHTYPAVETSYNAKVRVKKVNNNSNVPVSPMSVPVQVVRSLGNFIQEPAYSTLLTSNERVGIKVIEPGSRGDSISCLISYHNPSGNPMSNGIITVDYNPTSQNETALNFNNVDCYHGESFSTESAPSGSGFEKRLNIEFDGIDVGKYRNVCAIFEVPVGLNNNITNTEIKIEVFDGNNNSKGNSSLQIPIVTIYSPMEAIISEDS